MSVTPPDEEVQKTAPTEAKLDPFDPLPDIAPRAALPSNDPQKTAPPPKENKRIDGCLLAFLILLGAFLLLFGTCLLSVQRW
jgi:hypothetical protein